MWLTSRRAGDLDACVTVLGLVHESDGYPEQWPDDPARWLTPSRLLCAWVGWLSGAVAGHVCLCHAGPGQSSAIWSADAGVGVDRLGVITRLFVAPDVRRRGLGEVLLSAARDEARLRGLYPVLEVLERNHDATALYERLGWRRAGPLDDPLRRYVAPVG